MILLSGARHRVIMQILTYGRKPMITDLGCLLQSLIMPWNALQEVCLTCFPCSEEQLEIYWMLSASI
uniref:Uncharacterized protein MANES_14G016300 n=1 Tax=Rhizophora mucronata TaxID=61149 RepID=A0A2P2JKI2_RHIMU